MAHPVGGGQSAAERAATEVFVLLMRRHRVRYFDLALWVSTRTITHHGFSGPKHEVVRRYEPAPPFWPLTIDRSQGALAGYGVNRGAACIAYAQYRHPTTEHVDAAAVERVVFAPGCRERIGHASRTNPAFACGRLTSRRAIEILKTYLIDAVISLSEGGGALVVTSP